MNKTEKLELKQQIDNMLALYYENYYRSQLGLIDWRERIKARLEEEKKFAFPMINKIETWLDYSFLGKNVLVVGAGTGGECIELSKRGAKVWGIEPNPNAVEIVKAKARLHGLREDDYHQGAAEMLPFPESHFDFVYCYTVIEHVNDIQKSIEEMIRVCKVGGLIFIQTGDYRFPYEWHYKKPRLPFSPKWLTYLHFAFLGRPVSFLRSINFVTVPQLDRIFMRQNVTIIRIMTPWLLEWSKNRSHNKYFYWFVETFGIGRDQNIFLKKLAPLAL